MTNPTDKPDLKTCKWGQHFCRPHSHRSVPGNKPQGAPLPGSPGVRSHLPDRWRKRQMPGKAVRFRIFLHPGAWGNFRRSKPASVTLPTRLGSRTGCTPLAAFAVRGGHSGEWLPRVFQRILRALLPDRNGLGFPFHSSALALKLQIGSTLPTTESCASKPSRASKNVQTYPQAGD